MLNLEKSAAAFEEAKKFMPGGVNSPVRSYSSVDCTPPFISHAKGSRIFDIDGNEYIDYVGSWGPMILGHAHPQIVEALKKAVEKGTSFGAPTELETELAKLVQKIYPSMEVMRMVNSGTEATMSAVRVARGFTGRNKIIKFIGCYHGHSDSLLVNAGSGATTFGEPSSPGVTQGTAQDTISVPYNDISAVEKIFAQCGEEIAAVIVEPVAGNMGLITPKKNFLPGLRKVTEKYGAVLIFDEVMCGFRAALGGAQEKYKVTPDLTCLGKIVGGGLPCAVYGGRENIMRNVSPDGKIYQAGTLSGNPLAMTAGIETLKILLKESSFMEKISKKTSALADSLKIKAQLANVEIQVPQVGAMFSIFFNTKRVKNYEDAKSSSDDQFKMWFSEMLKRGIYLAPSQFETLFVSAAHSADDIAKTLEAAAETFQIISTHFKNEIEE
ncbi:MAG: glutamate-1-semialdehyde 2,1-aminomutase [Selenomonadaceae bacterium]|nr:glutamate-1-semialdehyde 2,1-aminomutase [Selenomonadaceae bacterium]